MSEKLAKWTAKNTKRFADTNPTGPAWPNEMMVKLFSSPRYSTTFKPIERGDRVLDIGCLYGNNLRFFHAKGCDLHGIEVNQEMVELANQSLAQWKLNAVIKEGLNDAIPFDDNMFEVVLSINTIHYQEGEVGIENAITEIHRVLKPGGCALIVTAGADHEIRKNSERIGKHLHRVKNYDFRDGDMFAFFDDELQLTSAMGQFADVDTARLTERYSATTLDFYYAFGRKGVDL